ncbi:hypothetical protein L207DRAFT_575783 [Hyaloscypha variabilis F]|uniref:Uncharacterized protein n=1 Tax=Hyaloscypha variabilis (strain UAMH 11265 / GT02V1 / F) TaxID=1149755 RepID=A0A2J6S890_HYAVF|nr:hypothetical protein L207DRAFT_575783 [Hyaloscypha variabilis F]
MSLYELCVDTKLRLAQVPGFQEHSRKAEDESEDEEEDPLMFLIRVFRQGVPLLILLGSVPQLDYLTDTSKFERDIDSLVVPEAAIQRFIDVMGGLRFGPYGQCFEVDDLMGDDSSGFMKVVRYIAQVLDILASTGSIKSVDVTTIPSLDERELVRPSVRDLIIRELLYSDRFYVENLEKLQEVQHTIERAGISSDYSFNIVFRSLGIILDKQRRLLLKLEVTARKPSEDQTWGHHFEEWSSTSSAYADYITGEKKATEYARKLVANWDQNGHVSGLNSDSERLG